MSAVARRRGRLSLAAAALAAVAGGALLASLAVSATEAAWTDRVAASASVSSGSWQSPATLGCVAMTAAGQPLPGGFCTVASIRYEEWGLPGERMRGYYVALSSNAGSGFIRFTIDLSTGTGPVSDFSWAHAALAGNGQVTPLHGWNCTQLPVLSADTPTNWGWGTGSSVYFQVSERRSGSGTSCS